MKSDCTLFLPVHRKMLELCPSPRPSSNCPGTSCPLEQRPWNRKTWGGEGRDSTPASYWLWSPEFLLEASASLSVKKWVLKLDFMHKALGEFSKTHENIYSASEILDRPHPFILSAHCSLA